MTITLDITSEDVAANLARIPDHRRTLEQRLAADHQHAREIIGRMDGIIDDGYTITGYAAVFNRWTLISDWLGNYRERISRGAFAKTIAERVPVVQLDHGHNRLYGEVPIAQHRSGVEDAHGLAIEAPLLREHPYVKLTRELLRTGTLPGMSFRFEVLAETWVSGEDSDSGVDERTIHEVRLHEYGPVMFPAYTDTEVGLRAAGALDAVRAAVDALAPAERAILIRDIGTAADQHAEPVAAGTPYGAAVEHDRDGAAGTVIPQTTRRRVVAEIMERRSG